MKYYLLLLLSFIFLQLNAQHILQTDRIEIPFKYSDENFLMALAEEQGVILFRESNEKISRQVVWEVKVLDTNLDEKRDIKIEVASKYVIMGYEYHDRYFYLLFDDKNTSKTDFLLVKSSIETGVVEHHNIANELVMSPSHLLINDESVVLGGYINYRPTFMVFDYVNDKVQVVPGFFNSKSEVLDFTYDESHRVYTVLMGQKNAINHNEVAITSFDKNGKVLLDEKYEFEENFRALNGKIIISKHDQIIIAGSYAEKNSYYSQGFYFGKLVAGKQAKMTYTRFIEIEHLFDYMSPKRSAKMKKKALESRKGNTTFEHKSQAFVHKLVEWGDEYMVISELYKPEFKESVSAMAYGNDYSSNKNYGDRTGQKYVNRSSRLSNTDGASHISYFESIMVGFDQNGKRSWDKTLPLDEIETLSLEQVTETNRASNYMTMMFKNKNDITYKSFPSNSKLDPIDSTIVINTFNDEDKVDSSNEHQGKVQHWYDNNYVVWGYQRINNITQSDKKRNVFFINKIIVE